MRVRATLIATTAIVGLAGCKDSGLPDRNLPFDEAAHRAPDALVAAVHPETRADAHATTAQDEAHAGVAMAVRPITVGDQTFVASGRPVSMAAAGLRQVGSAGGMSFSAAQGDDAPYDQLYLAHGDEGYVVYMPVHDTSGEPGARQETFEHNLEQGASGAAH